MRLLRIFSACFLCGLSAIGRYGSADTATPIQLPIEVLGASGTTRTVTITLTADQASQVSGLWLQVHGLGYADKASIQVNNSGWVALDNNTVQVAEPGKSYGGIGGGFATLKLTVPLPSGLVVAGDNTLSFRFNGTDGVSMGFRVLAFNFVTVTGSPLLPKDRFVQENPNTWQPPLNTPADIAQGKALWHTAMLTLSPRQGEPTIRAHCDDCHAQDGRDLKYFNYSNFSIIERSKFHGLAERQGQQIASYIRSLPVPSPGRPWNPPYQPGPGMDAQPVANWAAGAGLEWALDRDADVLPYLFPNGVTQDAVATGKTVNLREIPIAFQLPDWNHWLPVVFPGDGWGADFLDSDLWKKYAGKGGGPAEWNFRSLLGGPKGAAYVHPGNLRGDLGYWSNDRHNFLLPRTEPPSRIAWSPEYSQKVYSTAQWQLVKMWEMMQEFNLEGYGPRFWPGSGEARTWFVNLSFQTSPFMLKIPNSSNGIGGTGLTNEFFANAWYYLQLILDNGNRHNEGSDPIDWPYAYGNLKDLNALSGVAEPMRMTLWLIKGMQNADNGIGPEMAYKGWNTRDVADVSRLVHYSWEPMWKDTPAEQRRQICQAMLGTWFEKTKRYTPDQYYRGGLAAPDYVPTANADGSWGDRVWYMIPKFRSYGVDATLLNSLCDWAQTVWPKADWNSLKG